jgi:hypothetical protein
MLIKFGSDGNSDRFGYGSGTCFIKGDDDNKVGTGDGGDGGDGGDKGREGDDKGKKSGLDDDSKKFINQAITNQFRRGFVKEMITQTVSESVGSAVKDALKDFTPPAPPPATGDGGNESDEVKALQARLKEQETKFEDMQRKTKEKEDAAARQEERGILESQLRKQGVPDARLRAAVSLISHELGTVQRDDTNNIIWNAQRDGYSERLSVDDGVKEFLNTDEGKTFLPPTNAGGSGDHGGAPPTPDTKRPSMSKDQARSVLGDFLMTGGAVKTSD